MLSFRDVHVYEARNNYWAGRILNAISGQSLYQKEPAEQRWGFGVECDADGGPLSVHFDNGKVWSFCGLGERLRTIEWPLFLQDYEKWAATGKGKMTVRVQDIFSDSFHMDIATDNAVMHDILVWHYPPQPKSVA